VQVHKAVTHDGKTVAVKVEYPGLWQMMASDFGVFHTMAGQMKPGCALSPHRFARAIPLNTSLVWAACNKGVTEAH
jgi:predicted unusual protein kinase regulating ubiquinone biosynthesis (AarF/ABC1/UbiB family)